MPLYTRHSREEGVSRPFLPPHVTADSQFFSTVIKELIDDHTSMVHERQLVFPSFFCCIAGDVASTIERVSACAYAHECARIAWARPQYTGMYHAGRGP